MIRFLILFFIFLYLGRGLLRASFLRQNGPFRGFKSSDSFYSSMRGASQQEHSSFHQDQEGTGSQTQLLSSCLKCGTYFSQKQGVENQGLYFCSQDCARTHRK